MTYTHIIQDLSNNYSLNILIIIFYINIQMPIRQGGLRLWFKTKEQIDQYDDRMIASIQLKSNEFDDQNFSPVFSRPKKQFFLRPGEKFREDIEKLRAPHVTHPIQDYIQKYWGGRRDHTYWRTWPIQKYSLSFYLSYFVLREIPIRNFYARSFIMFVLASRYLDMVVRVLPIPKIGVVIKGDDWTNKDVENFTTFRYNQMKIIPNSSNRIHEGIIWRQRQPGFLKDVNASYGGTFPAWLFGAQGTRQVGWDGTFNMPLQRLATSQHKDAKFVNFFA